MNAWYLEIEPIRPRPTAGMLMDRGVKQGMGQRSVGVMQGGKNAGEGKNNRRSHFGCHP